MTSRTWAVWLIFLALPVSAASLSQFASVYESSVIRLEAIGHLYNGSTQTAATGTGFFVSSDGYVITVKHNIPDFSKFKRVVFQGRVLLRTADPFPLEFVGVDDKSDVALLRAKIPPERIPFPLPGGKGPARGDWVGMLGFQLNSDLLVDEGRIRATTDSTGYWIASVAVNPGGSGSPIFDEEGRVVGIGWGRMPKVEVDVAGSPTPIDIQKTNFVVPYQASTAALRAKYGISQPDRAPPLLVGQPIKVQYQVAINEFVSGLSKNKIQAIDPLKGYKIISARPRGNINLSSALSTTEVRVVSAQIDEQGYGAALSLGLECPNCAGIQAPFNSLAKFSSLAPVETVQVALAKGPAVLRKKYDISMIKDDHLGFGPSRQDYQDRLLAEPGYRIREAHFDEDSRNHGSTPVLQVTCEERVVVLRYSLESGPIFDRWRGWLYGTVMTTQVRESDAAADDPAPCKS